MLKNNIPNCRLMPQYLYVLDYDIKSNNDGVHRHDSLLHPRRDAVKRRRLAIQLQLSSKTRNRKIVTVKHVLKNQMRISFKIAVAYYGTSNRSHLKYIVVESRRMMVVENENLNL